MNLREEKKMYPPHRILGGLLNLFDNGDWGFKGLALVGVQLHPHLRYSCRYEN